MGQGAWFALVHCVRFAVAQETRFFLFHGARFAVAKGHCSGPRMGSLKSPCTTSYWSSIETTAVSCLVFEKIAFCVRVSCDKQTDGHPGSIIA